MKGFIQKMGASFGKMPSALGVFSLRHIRPKKLQYSLVYMFTLSLFNMCGSYFFLETLVLGIPTNILMYLSHGIVSVVVMLLWSDRFKWLVRVSSGVALLTIVPLAFLPDGVPKSIFAIICWGGLAAASPRRESALRLQQTTSSGL